MTQHPPPAQPYQPYPGPPTGPYPVPGAGPQYGRAPRPISYPTPTRVETVRGTGFGVAILRAPVAPSGLAVGALVTGAAAIVVSSTVWIFGLIGAASGNGGLVGGAFALLTLALGAAGLVLGWLGRRQVRRSAGELTGSGMALAGMICGGAGLLLAAAGEVVAVLASLG